MCKKSCFQKSVEYFSREKVFLTLGTITLAACRDHRKGKARGMKTLAAVRTRFLRGSCDCVHHHVDCCPQVDRVIISTKTWDALILASLQAIMAQIYQSMLWRVVHAIWNKPRAPLNLPLSVFAAQTYLSFSLAMATFEQVDANQAPAFWSDHIRYVSGAWSCCIGSSRVVNMGFGGCGKRVNQLKAFSFFIPYFRWLNYIFHSLLFSYFFLRQQSGTRFVHTFSGWSDFAWGVSWQNKSSAVTEAKSPRLREGFNKSRTLLHLFVA